MRDGANGTQATIPRSQRKLNGNTVTLEGGFEAGRTYELSYLSTNSPVAGLGFAAVRDTAAWIKYSSDALVSMKQILALVKVSDVAFPAIQGVQSPRSLPPAVRSPNPLIAQDGEPGAPMPFLVPQTNKDGIELAGVRLPDIEVPLTTYTGWNFRHPSLRGADQLYPLLGSYIPFPGTAAQRERTKNPRASIAERYTSRKAYLERVEKAGAKLVADRFVLSEDLPAL